MLCETTHEDGPLAILCSNRCPAGVIIDSYDMIRALRDSGVSIIGGFQTPIERDCLEILLKGTQPVMVCPARGVESIEMRRLPASWRKALDEGRLTLQSPFEPEVRRPTKALAEQRNRFVLERAGAVLVIHASPGGQTEALVRTALAMAKPVATLDHPANAHLAAMGARPVRPGDPWLCQPTQHLCDARTTHDKPG